MKKKSVKLKKKLIYFAVAQAVLVLFAVIYNRLLPPWTDYVIALVAFADVLVIVSKAHKLLKILLSALLILMSCGLIYIQFSFERLVNYSDVNTTEISFLMLKENAVEDLSTLANGVFTLSATFEKEIHDSLVGSIDELTTSHTIMDTDTDSKGYELLKAGTSDVLVIDNAMWDLLAEENEDFEASVVVVYKLEKTQVKENISKPVDVSKKPFVVLISGIDIKGSITLRSRSDVNMLMLVNPVTHVIQTISIPRDLYVPLACKNNKMDKLTHSGIYGINCTIETIEQFFGIDVNYYVRANFTSFVNLINVIGEIKVNSDYTFTSVRGHKYVKGINTLDAAEALWFARERKAFASGDVQRGLNQQEVIKGIIDKLLQPATMAKAESIISVMSKSIETSMTVGELSKLIQRQLENPSGWEFRKNNLSVTGDMQPTYSMGSRLLYVAHPVQSSYDALKQLITEFMETN